MAKSCNAKNPRRKVSVLARSVHGGVSINSTLLLMICTQDFNGGRKAFVDGAVGHASGKQTVNLPHKMPILATKPDVWNNWVP